MDFHPKADPWHKAFHDLPVENRILRFRVPHDVFSTMRIDEGTLLLLDHLPQKAPQKVLDLGCGYGALGLPVAARYPNAQVTLVDRDLLAVEWAQRNANENGISNAVVQGSLGFDGVREKDFDWILCNVPARIGKPFIAHLFAEGARRLAPAGEMRVVVIRDLIPTLGEVSSEYGFAITEVIRGPRHAVFSMIRPDSVEIGSPASPDLYLRDQVIFSGSSFDRPFDLGGDDPKRLQGSLPLLMDALPRQSPPGRVLIIRGGYGILPILCKIRWPGSEVMSFERDLLATHFTRRNAERLLGGDVISILEGWFFPEAIPVTSRFDLIAMELSPSAGSAVAWAEIRSAQERVERGGVVLMVCLDKIRAEWIEPRIRSEGIDLRALASRNGFTVFSLQGRS